LVFANAFAHFRLFLLSMEALLSINWRFFLILRFYLYFMSPQYDTICDGFVCPGLDLERKVIQLDA
jgi:hypothetical protein